MVRRVSSRRSPLIRLAICAITVSLEKGTYGVIERPGCIVRHVTRDFGISLALLREAQDAALTLNRGTIGQDVMYFETGQGSALSADAHFGVDQQTMETRAYAVARAFRPLLINTVVGFIGPEYLYNGKEIIRAGLEDHFCAKLLGLPMGCDVCYTNHAEADQDDMDVLLTMLATAGTAFVIAVP